MNSAAYFVLKFLVSVLVPLALRWLEPNATLTEKTLLGIGVFLGWSSLDTLHYLRKIDAARRFDADMWALQEQGDTLLHNMRKHYRMIIDDSYGEHDLFMDFFKTRLAEMAEILRNAAEQRQLFVADFHFRRTDLLLGTFIGDESATLRYVWVIRKDEPLFDNKWEHYCDQILKGTTAGAIKDVRALLILGNKVNIDDDIVRALAGFYEYTKAHSYKIIDENVYNHFKSDSRLENDYIDFGIYGNRYIYLTLSYGEPSSGRFCKDKAVIERYIKFYDHVWSSSSAKRLSRNLVPRNKLTDLLKLKW
jgi:hypothetical protein